MTLSKNLALIMIKFIVIHDYMYIQSIQTNNVILASFHHFVKNIWKKEYFIPNSLFFNHIPT
jgi:hypothetical protein